MMLETVILGAGPAGTGAVVWAARHGKLSEWLDAGIALVERRQLITGTTGHYALNADTYGGTFLAAIRDSSSFARIRSHWSWSCGATGCHRSNSWAAFSLVSARSCGHLSRNIPVASF